MWNIDGFLTDLEYEYECDAEVNSRKYTKDKPPLYGTSPYAAVCHLDRYSRDMLTRRYAFVPHYIGRMAKNFRPSGDILRLIYSRFVQFMGVLCNGV